MSAVAREVARVAARLFATQGYDATSVRTIVEAAGVTKPTLYYHFGSKEGLAHAILTVPLAELIETLQAILDSEGEPVDALGRILAAHFAFFREEPDLARFYFTLCFGPLGKTALAGELMRFGEAMTGQLTVAVRRLSSAGVVAADRVDDCVKACRGLITTSAVDFLYKGGTVSPELARRLVGDLLWGFGVVGTAGRGS